MPTYRPQQMAEGLQPEEQPRPWWLRLLMVLLLMAVGIVGFVFLDWLLGEQLAIPNVRVGTVTGAIVWVLLAPLLLGRYR